MFKRTKTVPLPLPQPLPQNLAVAPHDSALAWPQDSALAPQDSAVEIFDVKFCKMKMSLIVEKGSDVEK